MNELFFFIHIAVLLLAVSFFSKFGKSGLASIFVLQSIFANLFILKQTTLFGLVVTTTDCYTIGSFITLNMIREIYGKEASDKTILIGLCSILFLPFMSFFLLAYEPLAEGVSVNQLYQNLLTPSFRIFLVSLLCMFTFQKLDTYLFSKLRNTLSLQSSMFISLSITQFLDTFFFTYGALSGLIENLAHIVFFSYLIKLITISAMTPMTKAMLRRSS